MHTTCATLDASQLLRDILQSKESYHSDFFDNSNSASSSVKDMYTRGCSTEMISPLLQSKSNDMSYNVRDNENDFDNDIENDGDIDVATDNTSCANGGDMSDDSDERSPDTSGQEDGLKTNEQELFLEDTKEAKRAHVENILSNMRQSPYHDTMDSSTNALLGDLKRQKRKQPQPQQHESSTLNLEDVALQQKILKLQEQMQGEKRKREDDICFDEIDDDFGDDDDVTDAEGSRPGSPVSGVSKRAKVEHVLSNIRSSPGLVNGFETNSRISPSSENGKRQKRKQTQPQQHDNRRAENRDGCNNIQITENNRSFDAKNETHPIKFDDLFETKDQNGVFETTAFLRNNFYHNFSDKSFFPQLHNGIDPQIYRENLFRHNFFGLRPDISPINAFKHVAKSSHPNNELGTTVDEDIKIPPADLSKIAKALKVELALAVSKAIDNAVSKVFNEKQVDSNSAQPSKAAEPNSLQLQQDRQNHHNHHQPSNQQNQQNSSNNFPHFLHQHQQIQQQHQHRLHQHQQQQNQQPSSQLFEREALKETVNNSQGKKKSELIVPFSDHLHFLERFGNRFHQEKMSAFDPISKPQSELITPHTGPSMSFHPHFPYYLPSQVLPPVFTGEPEQTEALSLIVNTPKKKRTKVTDTRLGSPRGKHNVLQDNTPSSSMDHTEAQRHLALAFPHFLPPVLPTSVAITNPSLSHSDFLALRLRESSFGESRIPSPQDHSRSSPRSLTDSPQFMSKMDIFDRGGMSLAGDLMDGSCPGNGLLTSTLTPMHLRKAKLMFFYTRYPSSSILKMYFPDVMFNKNNTAQLVKWFSNFREFFYIQMEKYARQALAEGCKHQDDLVVAQDSELFRHLNLHYNRNNQLEVPHNFLAAVQAALREFFKSIQSNKDAEPSWKKAIYKIIARMDESLPDFFKSPNWMEQLGDQ